MKNQSIPGCATMAATILALIPPSVFPRLRSGHRLFQRPSRQKQIPNNTTIFRPARLVELFLGALVLLGAALDTKAANLLQNGGFELGMVSVDGHGETPFPWTSSVPLDPAVSWDTWHNDGTNGLPPAFAGVFSSTLAPEGIRWVGGWNFENIAQQLSAPLKTSPTSSAVPTDKYPSLHFPPWTIAAANEVVHQRKEDREAVATLAACPALSAGWRNALAVRAANSRSEKADPMICATKRLEMQGAAKNAE